MYQRSFLPQMKRHARLSDRARERREEGGKERGSSETWTDFDGLEVAKRCYQNGEEGRDDSPIC
jgi:hypothetical protein